MRRESGRRGEGGGGGGGGGDGGNLIPSEHALCTPHHSTDRQIMTALEDWDGDRKSCPDHGKRYVLILQKLET